MTWVLKITSNSLRCISAAGVFSRSLNWRRGVCTASADELQISSSPPWLMLSPRSDNTAYSLYSFAENRVLTFPKPDATQEEESGFPDATRIVGSSHGWLSFFNYRRNRGELFLSNPLSGRRVNLPPIHNLPIPQPNLEGGYGCVEKLIISSSDPDSEDCRALMSFGTVNRLAFCCPGRRSTEWTIIGTPLDEYTGGARYYEDFAYCTTQELFFTITYNLPAELEAWDLRDPQSPKLVWSRRDYEIRHGSRFNKDLTDAQEDWLGFREAECFKRKYLVVASQHKGGDQAEVFYVNRYINPYMRPDGTCAWEEDFLECRLPAKTLDFDVEKIAGGRMTGMDDGHLEGLVMFLGGVSHGLAMPASAASGYPPNSICFTEDAYGLCSSSHGGHDNGIFDYGKKNTSSCYYPCDYQSAKMIKPPPLWFTPIPPFPETAKNKEGGRGVCS